MNNDASQTGRYRALISPAHPSSGDAYAQSLADRHLPSGEAERIAARVPLPDVEPYLDAKDYAYTADQLRAAILAGVREAMRGGVAVGEVTVDPLVGVVWYASCGHGCDLQAGTLIYTAPPAGRVEVSDSFVESMARKVCEIAGEEWDAIGEFSQRTLIDTQRAALTAALQEPEA